MALPLLMTANWLQQMDNLSTAAFFYSCRCFSAANFSAASVILVWGNTYIMALRVPKKFGFSLVSYLHLKMISRRLANSPLPCLASFMSFHVPIYKSHLSPALQAWFSPLSFLLSIRPGAGLWLTRNGFQRRHSCSYQGVVAPSISFKDGSLPQLPV